MRVACAEVRALESIYILIPITFLLLGLAIAAYLWAVRSGQFDDLDQEASRILFEEDATPTSDEAETDEAPR